MDDIFQGLGNTNPKEVALSEALKSLTVLFTEITEFSTRELKALSLIQNDKYLSNMVKFYVKNKKHLSRKYAKEILQAYEMMSREPKITGIMNKLRRERF
jgi:vacuolar-type H+-ATPase subunit I/STV1